MSSEFLHQLLRYSHVGLGFVGLALFWVPIFAVKGSKLHIRVGRVFVWCAAYVGTTGLISSLWALIHPISFSGVNIADISTSKMPFVVEKLRFFFSILGYLSLAILCGCVLGVRVVRTRRDHRLLPSPLLLGVEGAYGLASFALAIYGVWNLFLSYSGRHFLPASELGRYWIPTVLGVLGVISVVEDLKYILRPRPTPMAWWYKHMENMLGVGIGFHTAFLVFGMNRLLPFRLEAPWVMLPWLLPTAIGLPAISLWKRYYQRKFGELEPNNVPDKGVRSIYGEECSG